MILALETATKVCSVAFYDDRGSVFEKRLEKRGSHSEQLFLFIEELQDEHDFAIPDLDAVLVSEGPGSYTGLRISASAVKGLLFQTKVPLFGVNTLASFAIGVLDEDTSAKTIHSIIDARRVHVYHQKFEYGNGQLHSDDEVEVIPIEAFEKMIRSGHAIVGTGLERVDKNVRQKVEIFGPDKISASSLIKMFNSGYKQFYHRTEAESFDPKYYTSNQVE